MNIFHFSVEEIKLQVIKSGDEKMFSRKKNVMKNTSSFTDARLTTQP